MKSKIIYFLYIKKKELKYFYLILYVIGKVRQTWIL